VDGVVVVSVITPPGEVYYCNIISTIIESF